MQCPKCQFENVDGANFCNECGCKLEISCPVCCKINPPGSKFCNGCGQNLTIPQEPFVKELSFEEKIDKIQRYLPKGLTEKILSQKDRIEGERKLVTVMFVDMAGFTQLSEKLGPEEAYSVMDQVYEILIQKVHDYEGTVNEFTGDGIMALFGAPIALEDAPQRAIRSAFAIHREMAKFSDKMKLERENLPALKMRIGIHTGPVVVGTLGNDLRVEFKAVGDTVNLASRMEGLAEPCSTYVTEDTFRHTEGLFRYEILGEHAVKGRADKVKAYRVIAPSSHRTRFDVSAEGGLTPFVGRDRELELLLDGFERCKAGRGQAFSIMSEAGIGKSRLLYEFRKAVAHEDVTFLEGRCLSYSRRVAYHPVIDILKANFDIREGDDDSEIRQKAQRGLEILGVDEASTLPYFLELLFVKDSGIDKIPTSPEARKDRIIEAFKQIALKGSEIRPLIMAFEDLHWADKSSEDVLKYFLDSIPGARVLLIFTYRPDFVLTWGAKSYHNQLTLNRLSNRENLMMVSHLLGTEELDKRLEAFILEKTEGVPFFIEQLIKSLIDLKIVVREDNRYRIAKDIKEVAIPATIQDVIMARIDAMPEGAKSLLQKGSVAGREFGNDLIKEVTNLPEEELLTHLSALKDSELLYERGIYPQSTYVFKHALTQDVAYNSLILKRRKKIHEKIGKAIEEIYPERMEEFYEMLAHHYSKSDNPEKAFQFLKLSGNKTARTHSLWEALSFYRQAIEKLKELPDTEENKRRQIEVIKLMEMPMRLLGYPEDSLNVILEGEKLSKESRDSQAIAVFSALIGLYYTHAGDAEQAKKYLENCVEQIENLQDINLIAPIAFDLGVSYLIKGEWSKAIDLFPKVIALIEKTNTEKEFFGKPSNCYSMFHVWYGFWVGALGEFTEGKRWLDKGLSLASALDHPYTIGMTEFIYGWFFSIKGDGENCIMHIRNCIMNLEKAKAHIYLHLAWNISGLGHYLLGDLDTCLKHMEKGIEIQRELDIAFLLSFHKAHLSMAYLEASDIKNAKNCADVALNSSQDNNEMYFEALSKILLGHSIVKSDRSRIDEGKEHILRAIKTLDELKIKSISAVGFYFLGQTCADVSQKDMAKKSFKKAEAAFRKMGMDYWLARTQEGFARL